MLISVIVPIYNMEAYLPTCVDSLLDQTFRDYEIILVNDGSRDGTAEICDTYAREHAHVKVIHKQNGGASTARNAGLVAARGEYITFCDPDDWVSPDYLERFLEKGMDRYSLPVTAILQHRPKGCDRVLQAPVMEVCGGDCAQAIVAMRRHDMLGFLVNKLLVRSIIEENGIRFREGLSHREDELFMLQYIPHVSRIVLGDEITYFYRVLPNGLSTRKKPTDLILDIAEELRDLFIGAASSAEGRYIGSRIYLQHTCEAIAASKGKAELSRAVAAARIARKEYLKAFGRAFLKEQRDRKVAARSRWVIASGSLSRHLMRRLTRIIHI